MALAVETYTAKTSVPNQFVTSPPANLDTPAAAGITPDMATAHLVLPAPFYM